MSTDGPRMNSLRQEINMSKDLGTEDDTFRILARPPFEKMADLHRAWKEEWKRTHPNDLYPTTLNVEFARHYGWTWLEYQRQVAYHRQHS